MACKPLTQLSNKVSVKHHIYGTGRHRVVAWETSTRKQGLSYILMIACMKMKGKAGGTRTTTLLSSDICRRRNLNMHTFTTYILINVPLVQ